MAGFCLIRQVQNVPNLSFMLFWQVCFLRKLLQWSTFLWETL